MNNYRYDVTKNQSINIWEYSELLKETVESSYAVMKNPVNSTEGYLDIKYPVRKDFLEKMPKFIFYDTSVKFDHIYVGFDNPRVDFSSFLATPNWIKTFLFAEFITEEECEPEFEVVTCGRVCIWINGQLVEDFFPYTRNYGSSKQIRLPLNKGNNKVVVYMDDLAERDVNFYFQMILLSDSHLKVNLPLKYNESLLTKSISFLESLYFEKDIYKLGEINIKTMESDIKEVIIKFDHRYFKEGDEKGGNIPDFKKNQLTVFVNDQTVKLGSVENFPASGLTAIHVGVSLTDDRYLFKKFAIALYDEKKLDIFLGNSLNSRKTKALCHFANLEIQDLNSAIAELSLTEKLSKKSQYKFEPAFKMIEEKGDCADFMFAPLLAAVLKYQEKFDAAFLKKIKDLAVNFRYWIDEPGNDVMWYFSENHALLFHVCQYFAGNLYKNEIFSVSDRKGQEQQKIGLTRLDEWFHNFFKYGFSEWNSTTYLPIDLIGFFSLYLSSPDKNMKEKARKAIDYTFKVMAINSHGGVLSSTYGRVYEHDLKAMTLGELSNIMAIAWNSGHFNNSMRAPVLFSVSDYFPPKEYEKYINLESEKALKVEYLQGLKGVHTYLYKTKEYSMASAIDFNSFKKGHQQHVMNISLGNDATQLWINNPGEYAHSGENRPSFWAGNGYCPKIYQLNNLMGIKYDIPQDGIPLIHLYLPQWSLDVIEMNGKWLYIKKAEAYVAFFFSEGYELVSEGDTRNREIVSKGSSHRLIIKCSSKHECGTFSTFKKMIKKLVLKSSKISFVDAQIGKVELTKAGFTVNGEQHIYHPSYEITPVIEKVKVNIDKEKSV